MNGQNRSDIYPGLEVDIILKKDQRSGTLTRGIVEKLLTSAAYHSRGIKVRLEDGQIGSGNLPIYQCELNLVTAKFATFFSGCSG